MPGTGVAGGATTSGAPPLGRTRVMPPLLPP